MYTVHCCLGIVFYVFTTFPPSLFDATDWAAAPVTPDLGCPRLLCTSEKVSDNETTELRSDFLRRPTVKPTAARLTHRLSSSARQYVRNLLRYGHSSFKTTVVMLICAL